MSNWLLRAVLLFPGICGQAGNRQTHSRRPAKTQDAQMPSRAYENPKLVMAGAYAQQRGAGAVVVVLASVWLPHYPDAHVLRDSLRCELVPERSNATTLEKLLELGLGDRDAFDRILIASCALPSPCWRGAARLVSRTTLPWQEERLARTTQAFDVVRSPSCDSANGAVPPCDAAVVMCLGPIFSTTLNAALLIEWLEYHRALGVASIHYYEAGGSVTPAVSDALAFYAKSGLLERHDWRDRSCIGAAAATRPATSAAPDECVSRLATHYFAQNHAQHDCMFRALARGAIGATGGAPRWLLVGDLDEFVHAPKLYAASSHRGGDGGRAADAAPAACTSARLATYLDRLRDRAGASREAKPVAIIHRSYLGPSAELADLRAIPAGTLLVPHLNRRSRELIPGNVVRARAKYALDLAAATSPPAMSAIASPPLDIHQPRGNGRTYRIAAADELTHVHLKLNTPAKAARHARTDRAANAFRHQAEFVRPSPGEFLCWTALDAARTRIAALPMPLRMQYECWAERLRAGPYLGGGEATNPLFVADANTPCPGAEAAANISHLRIANSQGGEAAATGATPRTIATGQRRATSNGAGSLDTPRGDGIRARGVGLST